MESLLVFVSRVFAVLKELYVVAIERNLPRDLYGLNVEEYVLFVFGKGAVIEDDLTFFGKVDKVL